MSDEQGTCLPVAVWFLHSETEEPLGQTYRRGEDAVPAAGVRIEHAGQRFEVVRYAELRASCAMRRFKVVVRTSDGER
jgi:hypothetical protein